MNSQLRPYETAVCKIRSLVHPPTVASYSDRSRLSGVSEALFSHIPFHRRPCTWRWQSLCMPCMDSAIGLQTFSLGHRWSRVFLALSFHHCITFYTTANKCIGGEILWTMNLWERNTLAEIQKILFFLLLSGSLERAFLHILWQELGPYWDSKFIVGSNCMYGHFPQAIGTLSEFWLRNPSCCRQNRD